MQAAVTEFAVRAAGYGIPGVTMDGTDVLAVYDATAEAVKRARAGDGPPPGGGRGDAGTRPRRARPGRLRAARNARRAAEPGPYAAVRERAAGIRVIDEVAAKHVRATPGSKPSTRVKALSGPLPNPARRKRVSMPTGNGKVSYLDSIPRPG
jgi:hypothetical protein